MPMLNGSTATFTPAARATSAVRSVEPSQTRRARRSSGICSASSLSTRRQRFLLVVRRDDDERARGAGCVAHRVPAELWSRWNTDEQAAVLEPEERFLDQHVAHRRRRDRRDEREEEHRGQAAVEVAARAVGREPLLDVRHQREVEEVEPERDRAEVARAAGSTAPCGSAPCVWSPNIAGARRKKANTPNRNQRNQYSAPYWPGVIGARNVQHRTPTPAAVHHDTTGWSPRNCRKRGRPPPACSARAERGHGHPDGEEVDPVRRPDGGDPLPRRVGGEEVEAEHLADEVETEAHEQRVADLQRPRLARAEPDEPEREQRQHQVEDELGGEAPRLRDRVVALVTGPAAQRHVLAREREQHEVVEERVLHAAEQLAEEHDARR